MRVTCFWVSCVSIMQKSHPNHPVHQHIDIYRYDEEEFHIEGDLDEKLISVLFLKIGEDYRTQIYNYLKVMLNAILNTKALK